jgi:5-(carboxyamino)imidazole ribonucleotide mutase
MHGAHRLHYRSLRRIFPEGGAIDGPMARHAAAASLADGKITLRGSSAAPPQRIFMARSKDAPRVGILMGSDSDWDIMQHAADQLAAFDIPYEAKVLSAHRLPDDTFAYAESAASRGLACIIAGAGGAAHLAGILAAKTMLPVLGVPIPSKYLRGEDSLLSTVQMPKGIPVATFAIGEAGAANAALFVVAMLALDEPKLGKKLAVFRANQSAAVRAKTLPPREKK